MRGKIQTRSVTRISPTATLRPALMTSQVVAAASMASTTISVTITNSDGESDSPRARSVKSAVVSLNALACLRRGASRRSVTSSEGKFKHGLGAAKSEFTFSINRFPARRALPRCNFDWLIPLRRRHSCRLRRIQVFRGWRDIQGRDRDSRAINRAVAPFRRIVAARCHPPCLGSIGDYRLDRAGLATRGRRLA